MRKKDSEVVQKLELNGDGTNAAMVPTMTMAAPA